MNVTLETITKASYEAVCDLHLPDDQQDNLAPNVRSLVESHYHGDTHRARAICLDGTPVGFVMWVHVEKEKTSIWRLMVAHEHQRKGVGRRALEVAIDDIRAERETREIEICYASDNETARTFYSSVGFRETGTSDDGDECYAVIGA